MLPEKIIYLAVCLSLIGFFYYLKDMLRGNTKPNLVSWFIWMLTPFIGVFFQIKAGASFSVLPIFLGGLLSLAVICISLFNKTGYWKINTFDIICGIFSVLSLILYVFTHDLAVSILFIIIADSVAYFPTIIKSWNFPETETGFLYVTGIASNIIGLLIIKNWIFSIYSFGFAVILFNSVVIFCIHRKRIFKTF